jgi:hypothetical protein
VTAPDRPEHPGVTITVKTWGPYLVQGPVTLTDTEGHILTPPPAKTPGLVKLCSCGHSRTRPFCDGSHKTCTPPVPPESIAPPG